MVEKLRNVFDEMVVYKDLRKSNFFSALSLPSFMRDWLLKKFEDENGEYDTGEVLRFVQTYLPRQDDWIAIKNRIVMENQRVRILAKISVEISVEKQEVYFALPDYGLSYRDTIIEDRVWEGVKGDLLRGETWGMVELGYRSPDDADVLWTDTDKGTRGKAANKGKIRLTAFKPFCPYVVDVEYYKDARREFETSEWIDVLLGAVDYNAAGYADEETKLTMLTRLLPFLEKRLNLIELAPKGTGKSYLFGRVSRFGALPTDSKISRATLFYHKAKHAEGLVANSDFVVLDEIQTIQFGDVDEMRTVLKAYLESGVINFDSYERVADAGFVLCGNISKQTMDAGGFANMFKEMPKAFHESALIDRFHGFIKGWNIPRMNEDLKVSGWALNSEYFCSILHELRSDMSYRAIVDALVVVPDGADTRDTEAVKRIATAYLKLLFPQVRSANDITAGDFNSYCLRRAFAMRDMIRTQLGILDTEYRGKDMPTFAVKGM
ncbi:MAG: BREX system Lon protease-like protein BrxL [Lachnospiraceae bacterium]|jgi:ATP-dependent Lon protease|nr:BREX system Lon protease-like protein BrxL [Lachnospiraceae bacterium]